MQICLTDFQTSQSEAISASHCPTNPEFKCFGHLIHGDSNSSNLILTSQNHRQFSQGLSMIDIVLFLILIHNYQCFQCQRVSWNGHLEPHTTNVRFAIKGLALWIFMITVANDVAVLELLLLITLYHRNVCKSNQVPHTNYNFKIVLGSVCL